MAAACQINTVHMSTVYVLCYLGGAMDRIKVILFGNKPGQAHILLVRVIEQTQQRRPLEQRYNDGMYTYE